MKVTLTNIKKYTTKKTQDGSVMPLLDKNQRPFTRVAIQTQQHGAQWLSGFAYDKSPILAWVVGQEVEIETTQNGQYLNFSLPKASGNDSYVIAELKELRRVMLEQFKEVNRRLDSFEGQPIDESQIPGVPAEDLGPDELPNF